MQQGANGAGAQQLELCAVDGVERTSVENRLGSGVGSDERGDQLAPDLEYRSAGDGQGLEPFRVVRDGLHLDVLVREALRNPFMPSRGGLNDAFKLAALGIVRGRCLLEALLALGQQPLERVALR